jgi:hypothetical protein
MNAFASFLIPLVVAAAVLLAFSQPTAQASPPPGEFCCAFADDRFSTWIAMAACVADYYAVHRVWPSTVPQLRAYAERTSAAQPALAAKPTKSDFDVFFSRFSRIEFKLQQKDLLLTLRFRAAGKVHTDRTLFHPGRTADEILQGITPK